MSIARFYPTSKTLGEGLRVFTPREFEIMRESGLFRPGEDVNLRRGLIYGVRSDSPLPRPFSISEYYQLAEIGVLKRDERVELIDGVIYTMSPIGSSHAGCVTALNQLLQARAMGRFLVTVQSPVRLDRSEPEPDLALVRPRDDYYRGSHPGPADVFLVIEVMVTSATHDRGLKLTTYATAGIPETWLVDLDEEKIEIHEAPQRGVYTRSHARERGETVAPAAFADVILSVDDILG